MPTQVTVLGTGNMGAALAATLLARGVTVTVWNRTASRAAGPPAIDSAMSCSFQTLTLCAFVESLAYAKAFSVDSAAMVTIAGRLLERVKRQVADIATAADAANYASPQATLDVYAHSARLVRRSMSTVGLPGRMMSLSRRHGPGRRRRPGSDGLAALFDLVQGGRDGA